MSGMDPMVHPRQTREVPAIATAASLAMLITALAREGCGSHAVHYQNSVDPDRSERRRNWH